MKKVVLFILMLALLIPTSLTIFAANTEISSNNVDATKIKIDGVLDEPQWQLTNEMKEKLGNPTASAKIGMLWNDQYFYAGFQINDSFVINDNAEFPYNDSSVEIYLDGDLTQGAYNAHTVHYVFRWSDDKVYLCTGQNVAELDNSGITFKMTKTDVGYNFEVAIPWSGIGGLTVQANKAIGFTAHVNQKTSNDAQAGVNDILGFTPKMSSGDYQQSANWAKMTLSATSAPDTLTNTAKKTTVAPTIDGNLNEALWSSDFTTCSNSSGKSFQYKYVWNDTNLYIGVKAPDTNLFCNTAKVFRGEKFAVPAALYQFEYDGIEFYFSPSNTQADGYVATDIQLIVTYQSDGKPVVAIRNWGNKVVDTKYDNITSACTSDTTGWYLEIAIPLATLNITDTTNTIGVGMCQNNMDTDSQNAYWIIAGNASWQSFANSDTLNLSTLNVDNSGGTVDSSSTPSTPSDSTPSNASSDSVVTSTNSSDLTTSSTANTNSTKQGNPTTSDAGISVIALVGIASLIVYVVTKKKKIED